MLTMLHCFCHRDRWGGCCNVAVVAILLAPKKRTKSCFELSTGQEKLEKVREFVWSGKVRERSGENIIFEKSGKSQGK